MSNEKMCSVKDMVVLRHIELFISIGNTVDPRFSEP